MQCSHLFRNAQGPKICAGYQTGTYNITIYDNDGSVVYHFGPMKYTQQNNSERVLVVKGLKADLMPGSQYEVEVTVESLGMLRSRRKNFSKLEHSIIVLIVNHISPTHGHASWLQFTTSQVPILHLILLLHTTWLCCLPFTHCECSSRDCCF